MASRSLGGVSITDMSRNPSNDICSVLGMGVALMAITSTCFFNCLSRSLCLTPKRCSSSSGIPGIGRRRWMGGSVVSLQLVPHLDGRAGGFLDRAPPAGTVEPLAAYLDPDSNYLALLAEAYVPWVSH